MSDRHRKPQRTGKQSILSRIWKDYRFEIQVVFLLGLGFFLLWEKWKIKIYIYRWFRSVIDFFVNGLSSLTSTGVRYLSQVEVSDIVGLTLILIALGMVFNRMRRRIVKRYQGQGECPKCGAEMTRVHKLLVHRLVGLFLMVRVMHMRCNKCQYHGMRLSLRK